MTATTRKGGEMLNRKLTVLDWLKELSENDIVELFGPTGTGKSKFALEVARKTIRDGGKVIFIDTEKNLSKRDRMGLGEAYHYLPVFGDLVKFAQNLPKGDLLILDSAGFPILTRFAQMKLDARGTALLDLINLFGRCKEWCYTNNSVALITNQPESELARMGKPENYELKPFGDKAQFATKEIWKTELEKSQKDATTVVLIKAFRSRNIKPNELIARVSISDSGVSITPKYKAEAPKEEAAEEEKGEEEHKAQKQLGLENR